MTKVKLLDTTIVSQADVTPCSPLREERHSIWSLIQAAVEEVVLRSSRGTQ
jgi:hypothetical protein